MACVELRSHLASSERQLAEVRKKKAALVEEAIVLRKNAAEFDEQLARCCGIGHSPTFFTIFTHKLHFCHLFKTSG